MEREKQDATLTLATMLNGAVDAEFAETMQEVAKNILDPNTKATEERVVTIKVHLKPMENRMAVAAKISVQKKLAQTKPAETLLYVDRKMNGVTNLVEHNPKQEDLFVEKTVQIDATSPKSA